MHHTLRKSDGGLGSEAWFLRTYGKGHDLLRWPRQWAESVVDTILHRNGARAFGGGGEFTGRFRDWRAQRRCILLQLLDSEYLFAGHGAEVKSEELEIIWQTLHT